MESSPDQEEKLLSSHEAMEQEHDENACVSVEEVKNKQGPGNGLNSPECREMSEENMSLAVANSTETPPQTPKLEKKESDRKRKLSPAELENRKKTKHERELVKKEKEIKKNELRIQKEKEKQEKQLEKERKEKEKEEKKKQLELERQAKKEQQEKEKEEKQRKKMELLQVKEEEKKKKEEEKKKREEERRKKEEEKRLIAEEEQEKTDKDNWVSEYKVERKKERKRKAFESFFIKTSPAASQKEPEQECKSTLFQPFQLRPGMYLAPIHPQKTEVTHKPRFDELLEEQSLKSGLYLEALRELVKMKGILYMTRKRWGKDHKIEEGPGNDNDNVVEIIEKRDDDSVEFSPQQTMKVKLLQFHENTRPAWYGTWRKKSKDISGRKPFGKDEVTFNYEVDSDDEWEDEDPGESLSSVEDDDKDDEMEKENEDEDDGFFVPHGYLSEDEGIDSDNEDENQEKSLCRSPKAREDDECMTREKVAQPVCIGCVWGAKPEDYPPILRQLRIQTMPDFAIDPFDPEEDRLIRNILSNKERTADHSIAVV